jgi:hypothetical protein
MKLLLLLLLLQVERDAADLARAYKELRKALCTNEDDRCDSWAADGQCGSNANWMIKHCGKACRHCEEPSAKASSLIESVGFCRIWVWIEMSAEGRAAPSHVEINLWPIAAGDLTRP